MSTLVLGLAGLGDYLSMGGGVEGVRFLNRECDCHGYLSILPTLDLPSPNSSLYSCMCSVILCCWIWDSFGPNSASFPPSSTMESLWGVLYESRCSVAICRIWLCVLSQNWCFLLSFHIFANSQLKLLSNSCSPIYNSWNRTHVNFTKLWVR